MLGCFMLQKLEILYYNFGLIGLYEDFIFILYVINGMRMVN